MIQGGLAPGGLNFDAKIRRESTDVEDLFIAHVNGMDAYARGLRAAAKALEDGRLDDALARRYAGFDTTEIGRRLEAGEASLAEMAAHAKGTPEPALTSGKQEKLEALFNSFAYGP